MDQIEGEIMRTQGMLLWVKKYIKLTAPIIFLSIYWLCTHDAIEQGKAELYNNIPAIKVYGENQWMNESLAINYRSPTLISGYKIFVIRDKNQKILEYYREQLKKKGWNEDGYQMEMYDGKYIADKFFFTHGEYRIAIRFKPPLKGISTEADIKLLNPQYSIYIGKSEIVI